ncbi:MAG: MFS transporter [Pseudomonadota bacterium]
MNAIRPLVPLLTAAGILLGGNGLFSTLIAVRGAQEGFGASQIGWMGTAYFVGFLIGCVAVPRLLREVGHIRTFAALASIAAAATLFMVIIVDAWIWMAARLVIGIAFSGLFTTIESWLNSSLRNEVRGKVMGIYRIIDITVVSGAQFMMPLVGTDGFALFGIMAAMISLSLVPVAVGDRSRPKPPELVRFDIPAIWIISPIACVGCIAIGITNASFRFIGPLYAQAIGLDLSSVATFISLGVIGGAILQYPLGVLSDRMDRRLVLVGATFAAVLASLFITFVAGTAPLLVYVGVFLFGAFSLPLYSLSTAHANDRARPDQFVLLAAGLMFFYAVGAITGPLVASLLLDFYGPKSLFAFTGLVHGVLAIITVWRMRKRSAVPNEDRGGFVGLLRTSAFLAKIGRKRDENPDGDVPKTN